MILIRCYYLVLTTLGGFLMNLDFSCLESRCFGCSDPHFLGVLPICLNLVSAHISLFSVQIRDTLPYLMTIMQPNLRPVNTHLYSQREKDELHNLVNLHIAFNLNYVQEKNLEGVYFYR